MKAYTSGRLAWLAFLFTFSISAHLPECPETISVEATLSGGGVFKLQADADSTAASGTLSYADAAQSISFTSSTVLRYGYANEDGRFVEFAIEFDGASAVARVLLWDRGDANDFVVLQVLANGNIVFQTDGEFTSDVVQVVTTCPAPEPPDDEPPLGEEPPVTFMCPRTIGYWSNHDEHLSQLLAGGSIRLGDTTVSSVVDALRVFERANAHDARNMLRAQLLATLLNLRNGSDPLSGEGDIRDVTTAAVEFLASHDEPVLSGHPDRDLALSLKDQLDDFNNSGDEENCVEGPGGEEPPEEPPVGEEPPDAGAFTIGYWKNHDDQLAAVLAKGAIDLGDTVVTTVQGASSVFVQAKASDARNMLRAQLLAALLNLANGADPMATGTDIRTVTEAAAEFLSTHSDPVTSNHPDRAAALALKDQLDDFNNSGEGTLELVSVGRPKGGSAKRVALIWSGNGKLQQADAVTGSWVEASNQDDVQSALATANVKFFRVVRE